MRQVMAGHQIESEMGTVLTWSLGPWRARLRRVTRSKARLVGFPVLHIPTSLSI